MKRIVMIAAIAALLAGCSHRMAALDAAGRDRSSTNWRQWDFPEYEKLVYEVSWNGITAAEATLELTRNAETGEDVIRTVGKTVGLAKLLFPARVKSTATMPRGDPRGITFSAKGTVRGKKDRTTMTFDRNTGVATSERTRKGKTHAIQALVPGAVDPISFIYALRRTKMRRGKVTTIDVFEGNRLWRVTMKPLGNERIEIEAGTFDARKYVMRRDRVHGDRPSNKESTIEVWLARTPDRTPLKLVANAPVGSVTVELVKREVR